MNTDMNKTKYGYYSNKAASLYGTVVYETEDGQEIHLTAVYLDREIAETDYKWEDKVYKGKVVKFLCKGHKASLLLQRR